MASYLKIAARLLSSVDFGSETRANPTNDVTRRCNPAACIPEGFISMHICSLGPTWRKRMITTTLRREQSRDHVQTVTGNRIALSLVILALLPSQRFLKGRDLRLSMCRAALALIFAYPHDSSILAAIFAVTRAAQARCSTPSRMVPNRLEADFSSYAL